MCVREGEKRGEERRGEEKRRETPLVQVISPLSLD